MSFLPGFWIDSNVLLSLKNHLLKSRRSFWKENFDSRMANKVIELTHTADLDVDRYRCQSNLACFEELLRLGTLSAIGHIHGI